MRILIACLLVTTACHFNEKDFGDRTCTSDPDCRPDESCSANQCTQKACTADTDCGTNGKFSCVAGGCVAQSCSGDSECGIGFACSQTFCRPSFNVTMAASVSNTSMAVTFDAPPDPTTAATLANYAISGLTLSGTPTISGNTVKLTTSTQTAMSYSLTVSGVTRAGDHAVLNMATATFGGRASFNVTSAQATNARAILLTFDSPPEAASAATLANYAVSGLALTGAPMVLGSTVTLTTAAQLPQPYTVTVIGVRRANDDEALTSGAATFTGRNDFNITSVVANNSHEIEIFFDAIPDAVAATTLGNYSVTLAGNPLALSGTPQLAQDMLSVTIATASQTTGSYSATVNNVTRASDNEPLNVKTLGFAGRVPFNVLSAASTSSGTATVTFDSTPVTAEASDVSNYAIPGLTIDGVMLVGNTATLKTSPQSTASFTVTVANVHRQSDSEGLSIDNANFTGRATFNVTAAASVTSHSVAVTFDGPPNGAQAVVAGNFAIPGLNVIAASYPGTGNLVTLTTSAQSANTSFDLTVSGVTRAGDSEQLTLGVTSFAGRSPFDVTGAVALTSHSIQLTFDALPSGAQTLGNYTANNNLTFTSATVAGTTVTLTTTAQNATSYQVTVSNVTRASDAEALTVDAASFTGRTPFRVTSASSTGNTTLTVNFNGAPNSAQATTPGNYVITSGNLSVVGTPVLNGNTVTLTTTTQASNAPYEITVSNVTRAVDSEPLSQGVATFNGKSGFNVASASSVSSTLMSVTFDAVPDSTTATNVNNYNVPGLTLSGPVTLVGSTVTMTTTAQAGQAYTVTVSNVIRASDSVALTGNVATFTHTTFNVASAAATSSHTITVTFDALPNQAQAIVLGNYGVKDAANNTLTLTGSPTLDTTTNTVTVHTVTQAPGVTYTVTVNNVTRASDSTTLTTKTASFQSIASFNVTTGSSPTSASITVTFDAAPNAGQATTLANYAISPSVALKGTPILSGNSVTIATGVQSAVTYTVTVSNVTRASDAEPLTTNTAMFTGKAQTAPTVTNVVVASTAPDNLTTFYNTGTATVTITGTQFTGVQCPNSGVTLDDTNGAGTPVLLKTPATTCTVDSDTQITATFPTGIRTNGATGWNVLVTNTVGTNATSSVKLVVRAGLVISEVYAGNPVIGGGTHEFIEVYNRTATAIDLTSIPIAIHVRDGSGVDTNLALSGIGGSRKNVPSHGFWLVSSSESVATDGWFAHKDATYSAAAVSASGAVVSSGSVYLSLSPTAQLKVLDKVGWKNQASGGFETTAEGSDIGGGQSIQRKPAAGLGATTDTDVNSSDFNAPTSSITPLGMTDPVQP